MDTPQITFSYRHDSAPKHSVSLNDGVLNVINGLGSMRDSNSRTHWANEFITQQEIENSYRTSWTSRKVHDIIPNDIVRPWRSWLAEPEQITLLEAEERRLGLRQKVRKALLLSRLYGGSVIILGVPGDNPTLPLDLNRLKKGDLSYIHVLSRHEITVSSMNLDPGSPQYGEPVAYLVNGGALALHPTRVVRFTQGDMPDNIALRNQGWGEPLLLSLRSALMNADVAQAAFAALPVKARTSILSIPGLTAATATKQGEQELIRRMTVASMAESMFNTTLLSAPPRTGDAGETLEHNQVTWAGIPEVGTWFIQMVAAAADVPLTRFGSISPGGLNSTGDADLANYHANLDAGRELDLRPRLEMLDEALIRSALGERPPQLWFEWRPFEVDSEATRANNANLRATAIKTISDSNTVPSEVLAKIVKAQLVDSEDYPGAEDAYREYEEAGGSLAEIEPPAQPAANDNLLAAAKAGLVAQGANPATAAQDAALMLADAAPMTLYVSRAVTNFADIRKWFEDQGVAVTVPNSQAHVTICYSRQPIDWFSVQSDDWGSDKPGLTVKAGGPRLLDKFGPDGAALVQMFSSSQLSYRHEQFIRAGATFDWGEYTPHISLAYDAKSVTIDGINPWVGPIELGQEAWAQVNEDWRSDDE